MKKLALEVLWTYKENRQIRLEDFIFPYGKLNPENEWVRLAELLIWDRIEERYALKFKSNGYPAHPCRMALGALLIKRHLRCSNEWTVRHVRENPYLQYFIGMKEYGGNYPFGELTAVTFLKWFSKEDIAEILEMTIPKEEDLDDDEGTSRCVIGIALLIFNLTKSLREFLRFFFYARFDSIFVLCVF